MAVPDGNYAYLSNGYSGMLVINISNPSSPILQGTYSSPGYLMGVATSGNYAFVTANFVEPDYGEIQAVDISDPSNPTWVTAQNIPGGAYGIHINGDYAYVAAFDPDFIGLTGDNPDQDQSVKAAEAAR